MPESNNWRFGSDGVAVRAREEVRAVYDYMRTLHHRFTVTTEQIEAAEQNVKEAHKQLVDRLGKEERAILLRLVDLEADLRDQACLNSFMSGYRLACGIQRELLAEQSPYCFAEDEEQRTFNRMEQNRHSGGYPLGGCCDEI